MLSQKRYQQLLSSHNSSAVKVYDSVPHDEPWALVAICREIARKGINMPTDVVRGCLDALKNSGLVKEVRGEFVRVPVRKAIKAHGLNNLGDAIKQATEPQPQPQEEKPLMNMQPPASSEPADVVETLSKLAQRLHATAQQHQEDMAIMSRRHFEELAEIGHGVADAAIEVQAMLEKDGDDVAKLRQLRDLMKSLGVA